MAPRIDLNLEYEEAEVVNAMPEETQATTPESADDDEGKIPFRTSKRLQGTIYRMIQQRDGFRSHEKSVPVTKDVRNSGSIIPVRKVKRRLKSLSPERIDGCRAEYRSPAGTEVLKQVGCDIVQDVGSRKRKTKHFTVHFADPLFAVIEDQKEAVGRPPFFMSKGEEKGGQCKKEPSVLSPAKRSTHAGGNKQQRLPPMSCFDLLCNHVGPRGWRCYRTCEEGKSFCSFHDSRKTMKFESGITQAVHI